MVISNLAKRRPAPKMGSGGREKQHHRRQQQHKKKRFPLQLKKVNTKRKKEKVKKTRSSNNGKSTEDAKSKIKVKENKLNDVVRFPTAAQQLEFFHEQYQSANRVQLSSIELDSFTETCMLELNPDQAQISCALADHMKVAFGASWKEILCEKELDDKIDPGEPAVLVISLSALRSLDLLRELRPLTSECRAAKLFSKHMKIEEQASALKNRVNIASGTPSRVKKLIDVEALGLSRLAVIVLDMKTDAKGYSLLTLPQVSVGSKPACFSSLFDLLISHCLPHKCSKMHFMALKIQINSKSVICHNFWSPIHEISYVLLRRDEFWDLYRNYFHQRVLEGALRICLYDEIPANIKTKKSNQDE